MINPLISIIIPTYNHAKFLNAALQSVLAQTFDNWQAIIVNNFSDDNTIEVVKSYGDARFNLINFYNNGVIGAARNKGLLHSDAPYIAFLDSDDIWYPRKLERSLEKLNYGYDLVCHSELWKGPKDIARIINYGPEPRAEYERLLFDGNCISTSAVVVRKDLIESVGGFSICNDFVTAEDYDLWLRLSSKGAKFGFIDEVLGEYNLHDDNQSRNISRHMQAVHAVVNSHISTLSYNISSSRIRRREALIQYSSGRDLQLRGFFSEALPYFQKSLSTYPWIAKLYIATILNILHLKI